MQFCNELRCLPLSAQDTENLQSVFRKLQLPPPIVKNDFSVNSFIDCMDTIFKTNTISAFPSARANCITPLHSRERPVLSPTLQHHHHVITLYLLASPGSFHSLHHHHLQIHQTHSFPQIFLRGSSHEQGEE